VELLLRHLTIKLYNKPIIGSLNFIFWIILRLVHRRRTLGNNYDNNNNKLIDNCVKKLKVGKACGPDDIGAEHILYAHPVLIMHLQTLLKFILCHRFVPNSFGIGVTIPLVKDKTGNINDVNNYRGVTLSPVISELLALCYCHYVVML